MQDQAKYCDEKIIDSCIKSKYSFVYVSYKIFEKYRLEQSLICAVLKICAILKYTPTAKERKRKLKKKRKSTGHFSLNSANMCMLKTGKKIAVVFGTRILA